LLYAVEYCESFRPPQPRFFILNSREDESANDASDSPIDKLLHTVGAWTAEVREEIYVFNDRYWEKSKELWRSVQGVSWDEVILNPKMKANLIIDAHGFFDNRQLYRNLSIPWKRGLILHGVLGNGKTISVKALINALGAREDPVPSLYIKSFDPQQDHTKRFSIKNIFSQGSQLRRIPNSTLFLYLREQALLGT
jgi:transitional endoplasmic reticulum ATPase